MKNSRWIILIMLCVLLLSFITSCMPTAKPDSNLVFEARRIYSLDHDPNSQTLYIIWSETPRSEQDSSQVITSYHIPSGEESILMSETPFLFQPWIAVGTKGEVYVLDNGRNYSNDPNKDPNVRSLLVFEDNAFSHTYTIEYIIEEGTMPPISEETQLSYLGMNREEENLFHPKFLLVETPEGIINVYDPSYALMDWSNKSLEHYLENNLQKLNYDTFLNTHEQEKEIWINLEKQFEYREQFSLFLIFGNSPCERVYDLVRFQGNRYNMGQCNSGIHLFPTSGNFFTESNFLIYASSEGVYLFDSN